MKYLVLGLYLATIALIVFANLLGQQVTPWGQVVGCLIVTVFAIPMLKSTWFLKR